MRISPQGIGIANSDRAAPYSVPYDGDSGADRQKSDNRSNSAIVLSLGVRG
jgi:hypothetical protein